MVKSFKEEVGDKVEAAFKDVPGVTIERDASITKAAGGKKMAREPAPKPQDEAPRRNATDDRLKLLVERIQRLEEEKKGIADDIRDVYSELVERIQRLEEEKKGIADDIRDVYSEAKAVGYDAKIIRTCIRLLKMSPDDRREMEAVLDLYASSLGIQGVLLL